MLRISRPLPANELMQLWGEGSSSFGVFSGRIYNGSGSRTITEVTIRVKLKSSSSALPPEGLPHPAGLQPDSDERDYRVPDLRVPPLETRSFRADILSPADFEFDQWQFVDARGFKNFWPAARRTALSPTPGDAGEVQSGAPQNAIDLDALARMYGEQPVDAVAKQARPQDRKLQPNSRDDSASKRPKQITSEVSGLNFALPNGTWIHQPSGTGGNGVLKIQNGTDLDSAVKLVTADLPRRALWIVCVSAHAEMVVRGISPGNYFLRFALGQGWEPETLKFLRRVAYYQAGRQLDFTETEDEYTELTVTLHELIGGNMPRREITEAVFNEGGTGQF
jgi:hypothetical protein